MKNMMKWLAIVIGGASAIRSNIGRWAIFSALNTVDGATDIVVDYLTKMIRLVRQTAVITLSPIFLGIVIGRFGMNVGGWVAMATAVITGIALFVQLRALRSQLQSNPVQATGDDDDLARTVKYLLAATPIALVAGILLFVFNQANQDTVAQGFILSGCVFGCALTTWFYVKLLGGAYVSMLASKAGRSVVSDKFPEITQKLVDKFLAFVRGYIAWATILALYCYFVPIYKNLAITAGVIIVAFFLASALSAGWSDSVKMRKWAINVAVLSAILFTAQILWPSMTDNIKTWANEVTENVNDTADKINNWTSNNTESTDQSSAPPPPLNQITNRTTNGNVANAPPPPGITPRNTPNTNSQSRSSSRSSSPSGNSKSYSQILAELEAAGN